MMERTGIAAMRCNPLHIGHTANIQKMCETFHNVIICLGSAQKSRTKENPFNIEERHQMLYNVFGERIRIVHLNDLGTLRDTNEWCDYIIKKINGLGLPEPTDYVTGSRQDSLWYRGRFWNGDHDPLETHYTFDGALRRLHVMDRRMLPISATEIRGYLELSDDGWKDFVPKVNWEYIEENFPEELKVVGKEK